MHGLDCLSCNLQTRCLRSNFLLTLLHSERPKLHTILAFLSAIGSKCRSFLSMDACYTKVVSEKGVNPFTLKCYDLDFELHFPNFISYIVHLAKDDMVLVCF